MLILKKMSASWCAPCRLMEPIVHEVLKDFQNIQLENIDVDQNMDLAKKYKVSTVPTLILEKDGVIVWRFSGFLSKQQLKSILEKF